MKTFYFQPLFCGIRMTIADYFQGTKGGQEHRKSHKYQVNPDISLIDGNVNLKYCFSGYLSWKLLSDHLPVCET